MTQPGIRLRAPLALAFAAPVMRRTQGESRLWRGLAAACLCVGYYIALALYPLAPSLRRLLLRQVHREHEALAIGTADLTELRRVGDRMWKCEEWSGRGCRERR